MYNIDVNQRGFLLKVKGMFLAIEDHWCKCAVTTPVKNGKYLPEIPYPLFFSGNVLSGFGANTRHPAMCKVGRPLVKRC